MFALKEARLLEYAACPTTVVRRILHDICTKRSQKNNVGLMSSPLAEAVYFMLKSCNWLSPELWERQTPINFVKILLGFLIIVSSLRRNRGMAKLSGM